MKNKKKKMKQKISLIIFCFTLFIAITTATQMFAKYTGYAKGLGKAFQIGDTYIYFPFSYLIWAVKFSETAPRANEVASSSAFFIIAAGTLIIFLFNKNFIKKEVTTYGSASFATDEDIENMQVFPSRAEIEEEYKKTGMYEIYKKAILERENMTEEQKKLAEEEFFSNGVVIGRNKKGQDLLDNGPGNIILAAQTGAGKGISLVLPTLWTWKGSTIINDIKGENWQNTANYRKSIGHKVLKFEATSLDSCHYNPLVEIRKGTVYEYQDARNIAEIIISPDKKNDPFFGPTAVNFLTGVILYVLYTKRNVATLTDVYRFISSSTKEEDKLNNMIFGKHNMGENKNLFQEIYDDVVNDKEGDPSPMTHPVISRIGADMLRRAEKERSGVISTAKTELEIFVDPAIMRNVKNSDFRIKDLMNDDVPVDLYFVTPPKSIGITAVLMKLLITQIIFILTEKMDIKDDGKNENYKHRLLFLIDEFPVIGQIELLHKALAYIRGYGMKACLIVQDLKQLYEVYGKNNSILNNCKIQIFFTPSDSETTKFIEEKLGKTTVLTKSTSYKGIKWFSDWNHSESYTARSLMTFSEIQQLSYEETLIFVTGEKPIKGQKIKWYNDEKFKDRCNRKLQKILVKNYIGLSRTTCEKVKNE